MWEKSPEEGERIEFLQTHRGPAARRATISAIDEQPGLQALSLDHLWILEAFPDPVLVPAPVEEELAAPARIPRLGAFVLNKANTFNLRAGPDAELRSAKDLLYLRDVMAAGERARSVLEADLRAMLGSAASARVAAYVRRAHLHLREIADRFHLPTARMLAERDGVDATAARADVEGHLMDLIELFDHHR